MESEEYLKICRQLSTNYRPVEGSIPVLIEMGFIIQDDENETEDFLRELSDNWENAKDFKVVLSGTTACNFRCAYCFENGIGRNSHLKECVIESLASFVDATLTLHPSINRFVLSLFGGEPTLNWTPLMSACEQLSEICDKHSVAFETRITTNGFLLDAEKLMNLKQYNCTNIEVTLDGPERIHDQRRMLNNGTGTFSEIIKNIEYALQLQCVSSVNVRINIDKSNIDYVEELLIFLSKRFQKGQINISLGTVDPIPSQPNCEDYEKNLFLSMDEYSDFVIRILPIMERYGFEVPDVYTFAGNCIAKSKHSFVLNADGNVYSCMSLIGREMHSLGCIDSFSDTASFKRTFDIDSYKRCIEKHCEFLPYCHTGCIFSGLVENGSTLDHACNYDAYRKINAFLLKWEFERGLAK